MDPAAERSPEPAHGPVRDAHPELAGSRSTSSAGTERRRRVIAASTTRSARPTGTKAGRSTKDLARPGFSSLERVPQAQLEAPRAAIHDATGLTELRVHVGCRRLESLEARIVRVVEDIECLGRQRGALEVSELEDPFEPQVDGPEREIVIGTARVVQDGELAERETPRSVRDRVPEPRADGQEAADQKVGGQPDDARRDQAVPFIAGCRVSRIVRRGPIIEAEQITANGVGFADRVRKAQAPPSVEWPIGREVQGIEPVLLAAARQQQVAEGRNLPATSAIGTAVAEDEREAVPAADSRIVGRQQHAFGRGPDAGDELVGDRRLCMVVDQEDLGGRPLTTAYDGVEAGLAQEFGLPGDR